jgi:hypothetical protein
MAKQKKPGFSGQWVKLFPAGKHRGDDGNVYDITPAFLEAVVKNYDPELHEAPAVIGHPKTDAPAYGWASELRFNGGLLEAQFTQVEPQFEEMVQAGRFKKRSPSFYVDKSIAPNGVAPYLRHVAFLGAQPPAVKDRRIEDIHFEEGDKGVAFEVGEIEFSEGATMTDDEKKALQEETKKGMLEFLKEKLGLGDRPMVTNFSEEDRKKLVEDAVSAVTAQFSEELTKRDAKIEELTKQVNGQAGSTTRASIVAFCESVGAERLIPALKNMGVVEFMETLAAIEDSDDTKVSVISFSESENKDVTEKISPLKWFQNFLKAMPPFVSFGEKFGDLKLKGDGSQIVDPGQMNSLRAGMGLKSEGAAGK